MLTQLQAGCLYLSRVIEDGVAKNAAPGIIRELPEVLKRVCRRNHDVGSKSMIMVLLFSARTACKLGWFPDDDARQISILADEMATNLCGPSVGSSSLLSGSLLIPTIMRRFYPFFSLGKVLASLEVSPGYGTYVRDFHILRDDFSPSVTAKIRLLVARTDMLETSLCLVSPQHVSFLVNGAPVQKRTCIDVIPGPQLPTNVTAMLRYGTNLLQAVGKFDGPCVMVIASMSEANAHDTSSLLPCVPVVPDTVIDLDLIEGPSRISLKCPISQRRMKLPVKGHSCRHPQCFDFGNFIDINLRRPSWRCPHCNQCICYQDIRVDQTLAKIMGEVGEDIADVVVSADGSWRSVMEINNDESPSKNANGEEGISDLMVNLTDINDQMDVDPVFGREDRPLLSDLAKGKGVAIPKLAGDQDSAIAGSSNMSLQRSNTVVDVPASSSTSQVDLLTVNLPLPPSGAVPSHCGQSIGDYGFQEAPFPAATAERTPRPLGINANALYGEYGHIPNLRPMNITRVPTAVQALPAPLLARMSTVQRARNTVNQSIPNVPPVHYFQQQHMVRPYAEVASSYGPSATMFSHSYNMEMQQYLNQYTSMESRIHPPSVGQPCHMNIQNSLNSVDQQASPVTPNSSGHAASSAMISEQPTLPLGRMRGSLSGQALDNLRAHVILPTQIATPSGQSSGHPPGTQQPAALPQSQKHS